jgi:hypothetical protein
MAKPYPQMINVLKHPFNPSENAHFFYYNLGFHAA